MLAAIFGENVPLEQVTEYLNALGSIKVIRR